MAGINNICKEGKYSSGTVMGREKEYNMYDRRLLCLDLHKTSQDDPII